MVHPECAMEERARTLPMDRLGMLSVSRQARQLSCSNRVDKAKLTPIKPTTCWATQNAPL